MFLRSLVIPGPTSNWPGLVGGTQYLARAVAECNGNSRGESSVVLKTNSPPPQGALTVREQFNVQHSHLSLNYTKFHTFSLKPTCS